METWLDNYYAQNCISTEKRRYGNRLIHKSRYNSNNTVEHRCSRASLRFSTVIWLTVMMHPAAKKPDKQANFFRDPNKSVPQVRYKRLSSQQYTKYGTCADIFCCASGLALLTMLYVDSISSLSDWKEKSPSLDYVLAWSSSSHSWWYTSVRSSPPLRSAHHAIAISIFWTTLEQTLTNILIWLRSTTPSSQNMRWCMNSNTLSSISMMMYSSGHGWMMSLMSTYTA